MSVFRPHNEHPTKNLNFANYGIVVKDPLLVKAYMDSRFRASKSHHIFILVDHSKVGRDSIMEYFCTCEAGKRTVGCCSHVMTIIWYLGYAQYQNICVPNPSICDVSMTIQNKGTREKFKIRSETTTN